MGTVKSKSKKHHIITNQNDAIITIAGYIRSNVHQWIKLPRNYSYKSLLSLLQHSHSSGITSYDSIPICIMDLIIRFYYFNDNQDENQMDEPPLTLSSLKVGDKIDAKDDWEKYYPATILYIKQQRSEFPYNHNISRLSVSPGIKYLYPNDWVHDLGLFIHYNGCSSRYDEWIFIKKHTICDCHDQCHHKDLHFISKSNTQSKHIGLAQSPRFGNPPNTIRNAVGLANLGGTSWLNATLQCLYHTDAFKSFIMNGKYMHSQMDKKGKQYKLCKQKNELFFFKLHDVFSNLNVNEFGVVSPMKLMKVIQKDINGPQFEEGIAKPTCFLQWILHKLSKNDSIMHVFEGRYQIEYKHSIKSPEHKSNKYLSKRTMSRWFSHKQDIPADHSAFLTLNIPIINGMNRHFIIDIYDGRDTYKHSNDIHGIHPPIQHRVTLPRNGNVSDLETIIRTLYNVNSDTESIFFYRLWGFRCCYVWNSFEPLTDVDDTVACYIVTDWRPTGHICHIHHVRPIQKSEMNEISGNENDRRQSIHDNYCHDTDDDETDLEDDESSETSYDNMNDKRVVHPYAFGQPFIISMPNSRTTGRLIHKLIYHRLYQWFGEEILRAAPRISMDEDAMDNGMEHEWDMILVDLPYTLRWVHKDYNFYFDAYKPPIVTIDDVRINYIWNYHANVVIEWNEDMYHRVKMVLNKSIAMDDSVCVHDPDVVSIYDCMDKRFNDDSNKEMKLWALPEVLVLNIPRFYDFKVERLNKTTVRSGYIPSMVEYPVNGLDLSRFMAEELTMNAKYDLYCVLCHSQTNHFYALCKNKTGIWYKFEDTKITQINEMSLVNNKALILFYKKTKQNRVLADHSLFNKYF